VLYKTGADSELQRVVQDHLNAGRREEALHACRLAAEAVPTDPGGWVLAAIVQIQTGAHEVAEATIRKVLERFAASAPAHNLLGVLLQDKGDLVAAELSIRSALAIDDACPDAWRILGNIRMAQGNPEGAVDCYRRVVEFIPASGEVYCNLGTALQAAGRPEEAIDSFRRALVSDPVNVAARYGLGQAWLVMGDLVNARAAFTELVRGVPDHAHAWFLLGAINGELGHYEASVECSRQAIRLQPDNPDAYLNLAQGQVRRGAPREAIATYREVVRLAPTSFDAWNNLGGLLHEQGDHLDAIECYRKALTIRPDAEATRFVLAALEGGQAPGAAPSEYVARLFDTYADKFDRQLVGELRYRTPQLLADAVGPLVPDWGSPRATVLDLGCGTGLCGPLLRGSAARLVGVDLSKKMLAKAREKAVYDELRACHILDPLQESPSAFDLIIAADVFPYLGDLDPVFQATRGALASGGLFAFSAEAVDSSEDYVLRSTDRYAHSGKYLQGLARKYGYRVCHFQSDTLRIDRGAPVRGHIVVLGNG